MKKNKNRMFFNWQNGFLGITRNMFLANWNWIPKKSNFYFGIDRS